MNLRRARSFVILVGGLLILSGHVALASAQDSPAQLKLSLERAIDLALEHSEALDIAHAGEARADADAVRVRSQRMPQLSMASTYSRTLASEFSGAFDASGPICAPLTVNSGQPVADRVAELERAASCGAIGPSFNFGKLPFGQRNIYQMAFAFSQQVYTGGRQRAEERQTELGRRAATLVTTSKRAEVTLDVTRAFYDAALTDRLVTIAESGYEQARAAYEQARLAFDAGRQPEFEVLRAQVARDNQRPAVIRSKANREIAYRRLRQLLELPADAPIQLDVDLDAPRLAPPAPFTDALNSARTAGPSPERSADRAIVQQAEAAVSLRQAAVDVARSERLPSISVNSALSRVGYPSDGAFPGVGDFRTNWSMAAAVNVPILTGGRHKSSELAARANLAEAEAQLKQARELSVLDAATALEDLTAAEAVLEASAGTVEQAERAYQIAELRNREGLSTQLELSDSRLSLQVAQANRAQAAHDVQIARARVALLPNLPVAAR